MDSTVTDTTLVELTALTRYEANPRRGNVEVIKESLVKHGQYRAIVVNKRTGQILAGNHTYQALVELGETHALVHYVDVDDAEAARIVLIDNRASDLADNDDADLVALLRTLDGDLAGTGYGDDDLKKLVAKIEPADTTPQLGEIEYRLIILCDSEQHQAKLIEEFDLMGLSVQVLAS